MSRKCLIRLFVSVCLVCAGTSAEAAGRSVAERYFDLVDQGLAYSRSQMPVIIASAREAAAKLIAGGKIYTAETQAGFQAEAGGRAGGMMFLKSLEIGDTGTAAKGDIILFGVQGQISADAGNAIRKWRAKGVYVVAFTFKTDSTDRKFLPDMLIDNGGTPGLSVKTAKGEKRCPVDTLVNVINLWVWTGELTSACTRAGVMPILYQSYGIEGGRERAMKYVGKTFHNDITVKPIAPGILGNAFLDSIKAYLLSFRNSRMDKLTEAAKWWRNAGPQKSSALFIGHMFPTLFQDSRALQIIGMESYRGFKQIKTKFKASDFVFFCGYQYPPEELIKDAVSREYKLFYLTVRSPEPAEPNKNVIYINPGWPMADGCVNVPGYDVPILPASGVVNSAIYWALLAEVCDGGV